LIAQGRELTAGRRNRQVLVVAVAVAVIVLFVLVIVVVAAVAVGVVAAAAASGDDILASRQYLVANGAYEVIAMIGFALIRPHVKYFLLPD